MRLSFHSRTYSAKGLFPLRGHVAVMALGLCLASTVFANPAWWNARGVATNNAIVSDYSPLLIGQLKWMATNAQAELNANLTGGAGSNLTTLVTNFAYVSNAPIANVGQLKYVASHVYDRLTNEGYTTSYPWTTTTTDDVDYAFANIGQLKHVFNFELTGDGDSDGLYDWWELHYFGSTNQLGTNDVDEDGLNNSGEYSNHARPNTNHTDTDGYTDGDEVNRGFEPDDSNSHPFSVSGSIAYPETQARTQTGTIWVVAAPSLSSWATNLSDTMAVPGNYLIDYVPVNSTNYIRAYRDSNYNSSNDYWEAVGSYSTGAIILTATLTGVNVTLTNPPTDLDGDTIPDWWEYKYFGNTNQLVTNDWPDGDGLVNSNEYDQSTDPTAYNDWRAPVMTVTSPTTNTTWTTGVLSIVVGGTITDDVGVVEMTWANDRGGSGSCTGVNTWVANSVGLFGGTNVLTFSARDVVSNLGQAVLTVVVPPSSISGTVSYAGIQTGSNWVMAVTTSTNWATTYSAVLASNGIYQLSGIPSGTNYWVRAFRDSAVNGTNDYWEAIGSYPTNPLMLISSVGGVNVTMTNPAADQDTDTLPDWWEHHYFTNTTQLATNDPDSDLLVNSNEYAQGTDPIVYNDWRAPVIAITGPTTADTWTNNSLTITLSGTSIDDVVVSQVSWTNSRGGAAFNATGTSNWTATGIGLYLGTNDITVTARDAVPLSNSVTLKVIVPPSAISGEVFYAGTQTGTIWVVAVTSSASWSTSNVATLASTGLYSIIAIPSHTNYWVRGFRDSDYDGSNDYWEALGEYPVNPIYLTQSVAGVNLALTNPPSDLDGDTLPDWWEYKYFGNTNQSDTDDLSDDDDLVNSNEYDQGTDPTVYNDWRYPTLTITGPTTNATWTTNAVTIVLSGTSSDDVAVTQINWVNDRGGSGSATGTSSWVASGVNLSYGTNVLTVTAIDAVLHSTTDVLTVVVPSVSIAGEIQYTNIQTGTMWVVAVTSPTNWSTNYVTTFASTGTYTITNVPTHTNYWLRAFRDTDGDGTNDYWEAVGDCISNPILLIQPTVGVNISLTNPPTDHDSDSLPDWWEYHYFVGTNELSGADNDSDGLDNIGEYSSHTSPTNSDTDGDGYLDGYEVTQGTAPDNASDFPLGGISGNILYGGIQTGLIHIVAVLASNSWALTYSTSVAVTGNYTITSVPKLTNYWIRAWRDTNENGMVEETEAMGNYVANPVFLSNDFTDAMITLVEFDPDDVDGDGMLDEWEFLWFGGCEQLPQDDLDGDGETNLTEYRSHTDPTVANESDSLNQTSVNVFSPAARQ